MINITLTIWERASNGNERILTTKGFQLEQEQLLDLPSYATDLGMKLLKDLVGEPDENVLAESLMQLKQRTEWVQIPTQGVDNEIISC